MTTKKVLPVKKVEKLPASTKVEVIKKWKPKITAEFWYAMTIKLEENLMGYLKDEGLLGKDKIAKNQEYTWEWKEFLGRLHKLTPEMTVEAGLMYIRECISKEVPVTTSGLSIFLGTSNQSLTRLENTDVLRVEYPLAERLKAYRYIIHQFKAFVEFYYETDAHTKRNAAFSIFTLKNMGWSDRMDILNLKKPSKSLENDTVVRMKRRIQELAEFASDKESTSNIGSRESFVTTVKMIPLAK
jgi:hypothetical protein